MLQHDLTERILCLRQVPMLKALGAAEIAQLAMAMRTRTFEKGDVILREDEPPRGFFLLVSGTVTMRRKGKRIGTVRGPGGVGFLSFLARNAGGTACVAESFIEAYEVPADAIQEIFEDHFGVTLGTLRWVAGRLLEENRRMATPPPFVAPMDNLDELVGDRELTVVERIFLMRRTRALAAANVNSLVAMARTMTEMRVGPDTPIWRPGARSDGTIFVVKGMLELRWNEGNTVQVVGPGYVLGGAEALLGAPRWNELVTTTPCVVLAGPREALIDAFEDDHELALHFLSLLSSFLMSIWDRKAEAGISSVGTGPSASEPKLPAESARDGATTASSSP